MSDALFIDASNLNVLYKVNGKFVLGTNYFSCPSQLVIDAQALGSSYDIYVSVWPRQKGEGDKILSPLSLTNVPFVILEEEFRALLKYLDAFPGANNVYICNTLANLIIPTRVSNYVAVVPYGSRWALLDVSSKLVNRFTVYKDQQEFFDTLGEDYTCYGDMDLIDVDAIRAKYPELAEFKKNILIPLIPLIVSYRSTYRLPLLEVKTILEDKSSTEDQTKVETAEEKGTGDTDTVVSSKKKMHVPEPDRDAVPKPEKSSKRKGKFDAVAACLGVAFCVGTFLTGLGFSTRNIDAAILTQNRGTTDFQENVEPYQRLQGIYDYNIGLSGKVGTFLSFVNANPSGVAVSRIEAKTDGIRVFFSSSSSEVKDSFVAYLNSQYVVSTVNEGDSITNSDGTTTQQYSALVIP